MSPLRILAVADLWQGSNGYSYVKAFRRLNHSVRVVPSENYIPGGWTRKSLRMLRRLLEPVFVNEYTEALIAEARQLRPHLFFVFKGRYVTAEAIRAIKEMGAVTVNVYPDVSFIAHGRYLPEALPSYDWVFSTKSFGASDLKRVLDVDNASFLSHGYDPDTHRPVELDADELEAYGADVSFIGTWSPKKQALLEYVCCEFPTLRLRVWGAQWDQARQSLGDRVEGRAVFGLEYAKALSASMINLAILSEARKGSSSGDQTTSRTFHIPASGGFMLHERTDELLKYFEEGSECACFGSKEELVKKIAYYLKRPLERHELALAGHRRSLDSGYSIDQRAVKVLEKAVELGVTRKQVVVV